VDAAECQRLAVAFFNYIDARRYDDLVALFTPDGVFERRGGVFRGRDEIMAEMQRRPPDMVTLHFSTNFLLEPVDTVHAKGISYYTVIQHNHATGSGPYPMDGLQAAGIFHDVFVRTPDGWRIAHRVTETVFRRPT
jgi:hypothetical protein